MAENEDERTAADDELARRRQEREATGDSPDNGGGNQGEMALEDLAHGTDEEDDGQVYVWEQGRKVTLGTLITRGTTVEHAIVFGGKRVKGTGGLIGFDANAPFIGRGVVAFTKVVPTRNSDEQVTKVTVETHFAVRVLLNADSEDGEVYMRQILDTRAARSTQAV